MVPWRVCLSDWDWWGNFIYLIGSIGYGLLDFSAGWCTDSPLPKFLPDDVATALWIIMAVLFVIDSWCYGMGWLTYAWRYSKETNTPIPLESRFWAEFYNIACSIGYVILACLPFQLSDDPTLGETISFSMEAVGVTLICVTIFLVAALLYFVAWRSDYLWELSQTRATHRRRRKCTWFFRVPFWAELFNILPSLIYVAGTAHLFIMYMRLLTFLPGEPPVAAPGSIEEPQYFAVQCEQFRKNITEAPIGALPPSTQQEARDYRLDFSAADNYSSRWFFFGDILFVFDSILYIIAWYQDNSTEEGGQAETARDASINTSFRRFDEGSMIEDDISTAADS